MARNRNRSSYEERLTPAQVGWLRENRPREYRALDHYDVEQLTPEMIRSLRYNHLRDLSPEQLDQLASVPEQLARILPRDRVVRETERLYRSPEALEHARDVIETVSGTQNAPMLLNSADDILRDAAIYGVIEAAYDNGTADGRPVAEQRLRDAGLTDVSTFNMGPGSTGRSNSNVQAVMATEHSNPDRPITLLAFRGTKSDPKEWRDGVPGEDQYFNDISAHLFGAFDYIVGRQVGSYQTSMDRFVAAAGRGDLDNPADGIFDVIEREIADAEARGVRPRIIISGHSYGADNAARMAYIVARAYPEYATDIELIGFGPTPTLMIEEQLLIYRALQGPDSPYANVDIDRIPDDQQRVLLAQWREEMGERVYKYRAKWDPFSIFTDAMQFFSFDDPDSMGAIHRDMSEGHLDYQAELVREAVARNAIQLVNQPAATDDYLRATYLRSLANLPREMDVNVNEVMYNQRNIWANFLRGLETRRMHDEVTAQAAESGVQQDAPVVVLDEANQSIDPTVVPQPTDTPVPEPLVPESGVTNLSLQVEDAGSNGVTDEISALPPVIATIQTDIQLLGAPN